MLSPIRTSNATARLEQYRQMITLDEAVEIPHRPPPFARWALEAARNLWLDISHAAIALFRRRALAVLRFLTLLRKIAKLIPFLGIWMKRIIEPAGNTRESKRPPN